MQASYQCPICDDYKPRLFVNFTREAFVCHNCDAKGSIVTLISLIGRISWGEALKIYQGIEGADRPLPYSVQQEVSSKLLSGEYSLDKPRYVYPLPDEFVLIEDATGKEGKKAVDYIQSRGLTLRDCVDNYIGYCPEGDYRGRIILPDFEDSELVYWQARSYWPKPSDPDLAKKFRKVKNPDSSLVPIGMEAVNKSDVISNLDNIREKGIAVICEGKMDALLLGPLGACIHGKVMSDNQFYKIVHNKDRIHTVYVMLDGDAFTYSLRIAKRLYPFIDNVFVCKLPHDEDPNSLGRAGCLKCISEAVRYTPLTEIKMRLGD